MVTVKFEVPIEAVDGDVNSLCIYQRACLRHLALDMLVTVTVKFDVPLEAGDGDGKSMSIYCRAYLLDLAICTRYAGDGDVKI